jgi:alpha-1,2-mannosyltransferase
MSAMLVVLGVLSCVVAARAAYRVASIDAAMDLFQHWAVVHAVRERLVPSVYSLEGREALGRVFSERASRPGTSEAETVALDANLRAYKGKLEAVGTPALYAALSPFMTDDYEIDLVVYRITQIAALVVACLLFSRIVSLPIWAGLFVAAWTLLYFEPVTSDLRVGNVSTFQWLWLGMVVLISRTEESSWRDVAVGGALGLATTMKPNLVLVLATVLLPLVVDRRVRPLMRTAAGAAAGAVACLVGSVIWFGAPSAWVQWARSVRRLALADAGVATGNSGLVALLRGKTHQDFSKPLLLVVASIVLFAVLRSRRKECERGRNEVLLATAVGGAATALVAPVFWLHYCVLLMPAALVGWRLAPRWAKWGSPVAILMMSSPSLMLNRGYLPVAVGVVLSQIGLFALALSAWVRVRTTQS